MCGMSDESGNADRFPQWTLENRFGTAQTQTLMNAWMDSWLTSADWDNMAAMGFTVVRLPFSYRNFQTADGQWITDSSGNLDFTRMDWAMAQAKQRGIYVIPVFHIWQGQQQEYDTISTNTDDGQTQRDQAGAIWQKVAAHYVGETIIAAYDAINEPTGSWGDLLQQDLYKSIRSVDANRIIILESISTNPSQYGWTNVMYSDHEYLMMGSDLGSNQAAYGGMASDMSNWQSMNVPIYIGEFMAMDSTLPWLLQQLNNANVWWSAWAYKTVNEGGWGLYNVPGSLSVDVSNDDYNTILSAWTNMPQAQRNDDIYSVYTSAVGGGGSKRAEPEPIRSVNAMKRATGRAHRRSRRQLGHARIGSF